MAQTVNHLPAMAEDMGSIPGLGRSHMPLSHKACVLQLLILCSRAQELQLLSPHTTATKGCAPRAGAPQERPLQ